MNGTCNERVSFSFVVYTVCLCSHVQALVCYVGSEVAVVLDPVWELAVQTVVCATVIKFVISLEIVVLMFSRLDAFQVGY